MIPRLDVFFCDLSMLLAAGFCRTFMLAFEFWVDWTWLYLFITAVRVLILGMQVYPGLLELLAPRMWWFSGFAWRDIVFSRVWFTVVGPFPIGARSKIFPSSAIWCCVMTKLFWAFWPFDLCLFSELVDFWLLLLIFMRLMLVDWPDDCYSVVIFVLVVGPRLFDWPWRVSTPLILLTTDEFLLMPL